MLDCIQPFCALRFIISDPWTTWGLEHWPSKQLKIPVKLIASPSYLWSPQTHGFNQPWVMWYYSIYYWKIAKYKWTCTIQSVVQRSAVYLNIMFIPLPVPSLILSSGMFFQFPPIFQSQFKANLQKLLSNLYTKS